MDRLGVVNASVEVEQVSCLSLKEMEFLLLPLEGVTSREEARVSLLERALEERAGSSEIRFC